MLGELSHPSPGRDCSTKAVSLLTAGWINTERIKMERLSIKTE